MSNPEIVGRGERLEKSFCSKTRAPLAIRPQDIDNPAGPHLSHSLAIDGDRLFDRHHLQYGRIAKQFVVGLYHGKV